MTARSEIERLADHIEATHFTDSLGGADAIYITNVRAREAIVRALLEALREPTAEMHEAGREAASDHIDPGSSSGAAYAVWRAMIDALLSEGSP